MNSEKQRIKLFPSVDIVRMDVPRTDGSLITCYVLAKDDENLSPKPAIVFLQGSGGDSVFPKIEGQQFVPIFFNSLKVLIDEWHVVFIEKRGVLLGDSVSGSGFERCSQEYVDHATREGRINDASRVIDCLLPMGLHDGSELILVGHSEGSHVAAGVSSINARLTHLVVFPFSAGHGLFDSLLHLREQLRRNEISEQAFLQEYDKLVSQFEAICEDPNSTDKQFAGHAYRRWSSYAFDWPLRDLLKVEIPIFLGVGSQDLSAIGTDWTISEFVKAKKHNLTYRHYINHDHGFFEHKGDKAHNRQKDVFCDVMSWVKNASVS